MPDVALIGNKPSNIYVTLSGSVGKAAGNGLSYPGARISIGGSHNQLCTGFPKSYFLELQLGLKESAVFIQFCKRLSQC